MDETHIRLDGYEDDAGPEEFVIEVERGLVRIELPHGHHGVVTIWPLEARMLASALSEAAADADG